jgi:hypothetical protein
MWLSSAFGQPRRNLLADPPDVLTKTGWHRLLDEVRRILGELKELGEANTADVSAWRRWRDSAVGPGKPSPCCVLLHHRRDAAAEQRGDLVGPVLRCGCPLQKCRGGCHPGRKSTFRGTSKDLKQTTRWRLLTVGVGTDHYEARAVRIGDWTGSWAAIQEFFDRVRELVEVDVAVGSLLYADTSVEVFSFPGERSKGIATLECLLGKRGCRARWTGSRGTWTWRPRRSAASARPPAAWFPSSGSAAGPLLPRRAGSPELANQRRWRRGPRVSRLPGAPERALR